MEEIEEEPEECGFHGVLRYRRESEWRKIGLLPPSTSDHTVWCEFCGVKARPPLDFSKPTRPEDFCCAQYMEMFKKVEQYWRMLESDSNKEKGLQQVAKESLRKPKKQTEIPGCKVTSSRLFTTISFRLSEFLRFRKKEPKPKPAKLCSNICSFLPGFGLCHKQGHLQKFYSNGNKFLMALPDGTSQVFYPSGNLAIITFVDDMEGVCIIFDDTRTSCTVRAFFQSSGIATCYHSNGNTGLYMELSGGLSQNEDSSRRRKWKWTGQNKNKPTPFKPIYLSLNKNIGVRVQGRESVFVTFLASGQQARICVGSYTKPIDLMPTLCKEELLLKVKKLTARLALERLRWALTFHLDSKHRALRLPPALVSQGRKLLRLSFSVCMEDAERAYIQSCLHDCQ
ncbi:glutamate-rich protein 6-like [Clarias gariepinus]